MAKRPKRQRGEKGRPWYRAQKDAWCIKIDGKLANIKRPDGTVVKGKDNEAEAVKYWHQLMSLAHAPASGDDNLVMVIFELYLRHLEQKHAEPKTIKEYTKYLTEFTNLHPTLRVKDLKPHHLQTWWDEKHAKWGDSMRQYTGTAIHSSLNWAAGADSGIITKNPLKGMKMPQGRSRGAETLVETGDHKKLLDAVPEDLRNVLVALRNTGTRPSVVSRVTANDFYPEQKIWRLEKHKTSRKTGKPMVVPLTQVVVDLCKGLAEKYQEGPLFRTKKGQPWNPQKLASRILWYKKKLGVDVIAYGYRHTVATDLLEKGVPDAEVAAILGHQNTSMIYRHYSHLGSRINKLTDTMELHMPSGD
jgi:integrase